MIVKKFEIQDFKCKKHNKPYEIVSTEEGQDVYVCTQCNF